jgi:hypothetical protein
MLDGVVPFSIGIDKAWLADPEFPFTPFVHKIEYIPLIWNISFTVFFVAATQTFQVNLLCYPECPKPIEDLEIIPQSNFAKAVANFYISIEFIRDFLGGFYFYRRSKFSTDNLLDSV